MVHAVRHGLRTPDTTFEILTELPPSPPPEPQPPPDAQAENDAKDAADPDAEPDPNAKPEPIKDQKLAKLEQQKPEPPKEKPPEPPKKEEPKPEPPKEQAKQPPLPPPPAPPPPPPPKVAEKKPEPPPEEKKAEPPKPPEPIQIDRRLAVRQHVEKEQEDNPNAQRIADQANKVEEETMAETRSKDQDDPNPTPGQASAMGPKDKVGDSDEQKQAQSEDKAGDTKKAPGDAAPDDSRSAEHHNPAKESPQASPVPAQKAGPPPSAPASVAGGPKGPKTPQAEQKAEQGAEGGPGPASPEAVAAANGGYSLDPANPGGDGKSRKAGKRRKPKPYVPPVKVGSIGLGAPGVPGAPNLNLTMAGMESAVGHEKLKKERASDGASRRSRHRGSWETNKWERWKAAIENYDPSVKPGNQTALNAARVPFATYINRIHNRLHPIFAEEFLASLDDLSKSHAFNNPGLVTHLEIVLARDTGRIVRMGITKTSGMTAFDIVALNSVQRASPFGEAPDAIVSPDGNVYLHWEFHRDPYDACTTRNARPFLLKEAPKGSTTKATPTPVKKPGRSATPDERGAPPTSPLLPLKP